MNHSDGEASYDPRSMAKDAITLADALRINRFVPDSWLLGGQRVQALIMLYPQRVTHLILIRTTRHGKVRLGPEPVFYGCVPQLEDEVVLLFGPASELSRPGDPAGCARGQHQEPRLWPDARASFVANTI